MACADVQGLRLGLLVGLPLGLLVGLPLGLLVGLPVGRVVGVADGVTVGVADGAGDALALGVGVADGAPEAGTEPGVGEVLPGRRGGVAPGPRAPEAGPAGVGWSADTGLPPWAGVTRSGVCTMW